MVKVFVIDHRSIYRQGLVAVLEQSSALQVVGDAADIQSALGKIEELQPDIIVMELFTPYAGGVEDMSLLQEKHPGAKVIVLTNSQKKDDFLKAVKSGAKGYLLNNVEVGELVDSILLVASGSSVVYSTAVVRLLDEGEGSNRENKRGANVLSQREQEILQLIAQGASNKEIANDCYISLATVKAHLRKILEKLDVKNRAQAVAMARGNSFVDNTHNIGDAAARETGQ